MATYTLAYDDPAYLVRLHSGLGLTTAGNGATASGRFVAFTAMQVYQATVTVVTAGTSSAAGASLVFNQWHNGTATALGTATLGSSTAGSVVEVLLAGTNTGGVAFAQGDFLVCVNGTDTTSVAAVGLEVGLTCLANLTQ